MGSNHFWAQSHEHPSSAGCERSEPHAKSNAHIPNTDRAKGCYRCLCSPYVPSAATVSVGCVGVENNVLYSRWESVVFRCSLPGTCESTAVITDNTTHSSRVSSCRSLSFVLLLLLLLLLCCFFLFLLPLFRRLSLRRQCVRELSHSSCAYGCCIYVLLYVSYDTYHPPAPD